MRYSTLIGIGLSVQGMAWCICRDENPKHKKADEHSKFTILDFQEKPANISELLDVIEPYRGLSGVAVASPEAGLSKIINKNIRFADNFEESTSLTGWLIASCINQGNLVIELKIQPLLTRVLEQDFLATDNLESPASIALKYGLGQMIHLAQTQILGVSASFGKPLKTTDFGNLSPEDKFSKYRPINPASWINNDFYL